LTISAYFFFVNTRPKEYAPKLGILNLAQHCFLQASIAKCTNTLAISYSPFSEKTFDIKEKHLVYVPLDSYKTKDKFMCYSAKKVFVAIAVATAILRFTFSLQAIEPKWGQLTFDYSPHQLVHLKQLPKGPQRITAQHLRRLDDEVSSLVDTAGLSAIDQTILPPYIANVQKDYAWLSYLLTGDYAGNLGPVTLWTLQLFIPNASLPSVKKESFDVFTSSIASLVVKKAFARLIEEKKGLKDYPIKNEKNLWKPTAPGYIGLNFGSANTWYLDSSSEQVAEAPPEKNDFWKAQCQEVIHAQKRLNDDKLYAVFKWAGMISDDSASWEKVLSNYLNEKKVPISDQLYIRSVFFSALADSNAAAFHSKYLYWVMRPSQRDPLINPVIPNPNHPSYPSAHSTIGATAAKILTAFFPENSAKWDALAEEAGMSRIWGGIHYPCDHQAGQKLGNQVGDIVLKRSTLSPRTISEEHTERHSKFDF